MSETFELRRTFAFEAAHRLPHVQPGQLDRTFDAVLVHDAVMYMTTEDDLRAAGVEVGTT